MYELHLYETDQSIWQVVILRLITLHYITQIENH